MPGALRFGPFELDRANQSLSRDSREIRLAPKAFAVLLHLADHAGSLITKDDLLDAVWGDIHVTDGALKRCVVEIRRALQDPVGEPRFIQTLHGRGYRFLPEAAMTAGPGVPVDDRRAPVVGREAEIQALNSSFDKVLNGTRQIVFVTGEAGLGKSTLVDYFLQQLTTRESPSIPAAVGRGRCLQQFGGGEPYLPVFEALDQLSRSLGLRLVTVLRSHAPTWLLHMPSLISLQDRVSLREAVFGATRERMLREITDALEALSAAAPIVLVLEDLHWSDPSTIDLLTSIASRTLPAKLMVLATYRPAELGGISHPLSQIQRELQIHSQCRVLSLSYLTQADIRDYVSCRFSKPYSHDALIAPLHRRSSGNPLFVVCMLDELVRSGRMDPEKISEIIPDTVQSMFEHQAGQLTESEREIVDAAAVEGELFSTATIAAALDRDPLEVESSCEALVGRHLFLRRAEPICFPDGTPSPRYSFLHVLCRDFLYRRLPLNRQARLHGLVGRAMEELFASDPTRVAAELAGHFELAARFSHAIRYLRIAADAAAARFANREAAGHLERAIQLLERVEYDTTSIRMDLLEQRAVMRLSTMDLEGSAADFAAAGAHARVAGDVNRQVKALLGSVMPWGFLNYKQALAAIEEACRLKGGAEPVLAALVDAYRAGVWTYFFGWNRDLEDLLNAAQSTLHSVTDPAVRCRFLWMEAFVRYGASDYKACARVAGEFRLYARRAGSFHQYFLATHNLVMGLVQQGNLGEALQIAREGVALAAANHHRLEQFWLESLNAVIAIEALDFDSALRTCECIAREPIMLSHHLTPQVLLWLGKARLGVGDLVGASEAFSRFATAIEAGGVGFEYHIPLLQAQASCAIARGDAGECRTLAARSIQLAQEHRAPAYIAHGYQLLSEVATRTDDDTSAAEHILAAMAALNGFEISNVEWRVHAAAVGALAKVGRTDESAQARAHALRVGERVAATLSNEPALQICLLSRITEQLAMRSSA